MANMTGKHRADREFTEESLSAAEHQALRYRLVRSGFRGGDLQLVLRPAKGGGAAAVRGILLSYDHRAEADALAYCFDARVGADGTVEADIPLAGLALKKTHWTLWVLAEDGGEAYRIPILTNPRTRARLVRDMLRPGTSRLGGDIRFLRVKPGGRLGMICRDIEDYDRLSFRLKELCAAALYLLGRGKAKRDRLLLIHEKKCFRASDNAWYLFRHCMESGAERALGRKICYVIDKRAPDYAKMKTWDANVIDAWSVRHLVALLGCRAIASTESRMHDYAWFPSVSLIAPIVRKKRHIFLQHGVLAIKRLPDMFLAGNMRSSLVTCISQGEADIVRDALGFPEDSIAQTGYARFDALEDLSGDSREILLMPSIRTNIFWAGEAEFKKDPYYEVYTGILDDSALHEVLERHDLRLNFFLHPSITRFEGLFHTVSDRVRIVRDGEVSLDELMMRCRLLVTDYSSIAWDVCYLGKPILFFQYDIEDFLATSGSYIDLREDLPGERTEDAHELVAMIGRYAEGGFALPEDRSRSPPSILPAAHARALPTLPLP
ncbi:MAG: CDP-glycerol glycerophosphotransferase family protein, partial [Clostridiales Family XIII bacterium]|nr:CDP-glycerol glycerophosphotransferase family protein [Clostridiales Family XIII bacterium]